MGSISLEAAAALDSYFLAPINRAAREVDSSPLW
jgi:hypothetical protein